MWLWSKFFINAPLITTPSTFRLKRQNPYWLSRISASGTHGRVEQNVAGVGLRHAPHERNIPLVAHHLPLSKMHHHFRLQPPPPPPPSPPYCPVPAPAGSWAVAAACSRGSSWPVSIHGGATGTRGGRSDSLTSLDPHIHTLSTSSLTKCGSVSLTSLAPHDPHEISIDVKTGLVTRHKN
jgi:hypothetical protein